MGGTLAGWRFYNPVRLTIGRGCRQQVLPELAGKHLLVVSSPRGRERFCADRVLGALCHTAVVTWLDAVTENPGLAQMQQAIDRVRGHPFDAVVAFGGGSAMDTAKVVALALDPEIGGKDLASLLMDPPSWLQARPPSLYALPTTAGSGSEVTPFATIWDHRAKKKHSLTGEPIFPHAAYVDAELTAGLPSQVSLTTGLDAINQAAESVWNKNANTITLALAAKALTRGFAALPQVICRPDDLAAREQMAECSLLAGLCISQTRTALCHSISYPLTAHFGIPHGLACAFTMPAVLRHNLAMEDGRFADLAEQLTGRRDPQALVDRFDELHQTLDVTACVRHYLPDLEALMHLIDEMFTPGRVENNLAPTDARQVKAILKASFA